MKNLSYKISELGEPVFVSRSSELYHWEDGKLLKLFLTSGNADFFDAEAKNLIETFEKGISDIERFELVEIEGRKGFIIKRLAGKTLLGFLNEDPSYLPKIYDHMAQLQLKMHDTSSENMRDYKDILLSSLASEPLSFLNKDQVEKVKKYADKLPSDNKILHLDYHPDNIMSDNETYTSIIDWATGAKGHPFADVATTVYLLSEAEVVPGLTKEEEMFINQIRKDILDKYLERYRKVVDVSDEDIAVWRLAVLIIRLGVWNIASEIQMLQDKICKEIEKLDV